MVISAEISGRTHRDLLRRSRLAALSGATVLDGPTRDSMNTPYESVEPPLSTRAYQRWQLDCSNDVRRSMSGVCGGHSGGLTGGLLVLVGSVMIVEELEEGVCI